jgi:hypothetical protein
MLEGVRQIRDQIVDDDERIIQHLRAIASQSRRASLQAGETPHGSGDQVRQVGSDQRRRPSRGQKARGRSIPLI